MPSFPAHDGTLLAYHETGDGPPLICLPGGPMQASAYLGDLGGLTARRRLIRLDLRGTGGSATPQDLASCRCDRIVDDVEALREHLGLERPDLLGHSAGANIAVQYAARHPGRVGRLVLVTPSVMAVGIEITGEDRRAAARARQGEPWFGPAYAALEAITSGRGGEAEWEAIAPFAYGRWDDAARAHKAAEARQRNDAAAAAFVADGAFEPEATRKGLAAFDRPVLLVTGEADISAPPPAMTAFAALFPAAGLVRQAATAHFPWLDDPVAFAATTTEFLAGWLV
jgi:pimeloyl-ACP methyl ester carboxylesterase